MPTIGRWVLETAAAAAVAWPANIGVAVNVSQVQFMRGNLLEAVREVLGKTGLSPARLSLEITESLFLQATHEVAATMDAICAMGVRFALDDFGTGYSSLAYVRKFPIATIKIDRSFVADLPADEGAVAIVRTISALAESLHMRRGCRGHRVDPSRSASCACSAAPGGRAIFTAPPCRPPTSRHWCARATNAGSWRLPPLGEHLVENLRKHRRGIPSPRSGGGGTA